VRTSVAELRHHEGLQGKAGRREGGESAKGEEGRGGGKGGKKSISSRPPSSLRAGMHKITQTESAIIWMPE